MKPFSRLFAGLADSFFTISPRQLAGMIAGAFVAILIGILFSGCETVRGHPYVKIGTQRGELYLSPLPMSNRESELCAQELGARVIWNIP